MMVIESYPENKHNLSKDTNDKNSKDKREPIHYKQLVNYVPDEIIQIFAERGVAVECHTCNHEYVDKGKKDYFTYDYSICPNCKAFNLLIKKDDEKKKKCSISMEREYIKGDSAVLFLTRKDIPNDVKVEITLMFNGKQDAIQFLALLDGKVNNKSIKVLVTTH